MKQNLSNFFVVLLTAVFFLTGCGMNNTGNETNSAQSGNISYEYTLAAAFTQVKANSKAAEVITG
ncbi:MAG: hypothetical protein GY754_15595, partial [bacterium]|nr:hypothetical protein [bacterium]